MSETAILPGAAPFRYDTGSTTGILLLHGFTASPQALHDLAVRLREAGFSSEAPLLPGHGTTVHDLNNTSWLQIERAAERALEQMAARFKKVIIVGESSGGSLALRLAAKHQDLVAGLVTAGASLLFPQDWLVRLTTPLYRRIKPAFRKVHRADVKDRSALSTRVAYTHIPMRAFNRLLAYTRQARAECSRVTAPLLVLQAVHDHAVSPKSADIICDNASSSYKKIIWYPESYHIILIDLEKEQVFRDILQFVQRIETGTLPRTAS